MVVEAQASGLNCFVSEAVTTEVDFTGNVTFLELDDNAENWGRAILNTLSNKLREREEISQKVEESKFNIVNEAKRLENILTNKM